MSGQSRAGGRKRPARQSLQEYARGVVGGLLFSLPLIYTMEVWWAGFIARPSHLLLYFGAGFLLLFGYNRYAGLHEDASWWEVAFEAVEEMGLGFLVAAGTLWLLGRLNAGMPSEEILGKIVVEGVMAAIGVSVGAAQLGNAGGKGNGGSNQGMKGEENGEEPPGLAAQLVLAACGAVLFASNIAPTEEILMIAVETSPWKILGLALLSLVLGGVILFQSDFRGSQRQTPDDSRNSFTVASRITANYAVALVTSALILWFFGRFDGMSVGTCVAQTVVLGVAGSLGASAGRLLLQR
ncbi:MAG TPA: TIGR02587 family membrane protein [Thermoanaerobaculia bacterium]|nr:TIGR02587 family membrane protein [Thermoanaerobaculia bacterium]